jgi:hypothetical protein
MPNLTSHTLNDLATPSDLWRAVGSYSVNPFVGLWDLPSLPYGTASWPSQPSRKVRPVGLTAFPGVPVRGRLLFILSNYFLPITLRLSLLRQNL